MFDHKKWEIKIFSATKKDTNSHQFFVFCQRDNAFFFWDFTNTIQDYYHYYLVIVRRGKNAPQNPCCSILSSSKERMETTGASWEALVKSFTRFCSARAEDGIDSPRAFYGPPIRSIRNAKRNGPAFAGCWGASSGIARKKGKFSNLRSINRVLLNAAKKQGFCRNFCKFPLSMEIDATLCGFYCFYNVSIIRLSLHHEIGKGDWK